MGSVSFWITSEKNFFVGPVGEKERRDQKRPLGEGRQLHHADAGCDGQPHELLAA